MQRGYIKLWRKSLDSALMRNPELWLFWTWCLLKASHKEKKIMVGYQEITLNPGDFIFGRFKASEELCLSERKIRTCLKTLKKTENVTIKVTNKFSVISVINWPLYQGGESESDQQSDQQATSKRPASDHKQECIKNVKNTFSPDSLEFRLSSLLFKKIKIRNNGHKPPDLQKWATHIDLMIRIDKRKPEKIQDMINWCQQDEFWQNNILSTEKLRKQFDKLVLKMGKSQEPRPQPKVIRAGDESILRNE